MEDNFLIQLVRDSAKEIALLDLLFVIREGLVFSGPLVIKNSQLSEK